MKALLIVNNAIELLDMYQNTLRLYTLGRQDIIASLKWNMESSGLDPKTVPKVIVAPTKNFSDPYTSDTMKFFKKLL